MSAIRACSSCTRQSTCARWFSSSTLWSLMVLMVERGFTFTPRLVLVETAITSITFGKRRLYRDRILLSSSSTAVDSLSAQTAHTRGEAHEQRQERDSGDTHRPSSSFS